eukprot:CAMPEP_0206136926 /NCGR_PEP_ID=MMETSP1473-20131121/2129_1 /ASSEMBLY_ACC=CAM_ASM_001109 /TAXON_ID=1461547 /ORGANISM="Stichococcus sp, Strain RCC1054" /LENGTH=88 /DNA_ID=CAMNT_0053529769 /DNA_START=437 /DNA_END=700 /DNA_ORIENTATION=+
MPLPVPWSLRNERSSEVIASGKNLLPSGVQIDGMLELCDVAALALAQGRVCIHNPSVAKVLQSHLVFSLPYPVQIPFAEGQGAEVAVD